MGFQQMLVYPCLITSNYSAKQPQESTRADIHLVPLQGGSSQAVKLECKSRGVNVTTSRPHGVALVGQHRSCYTEASVYAMSILSLNFKAGVAKRSVSLPMNNDCSSSMLKKFLCLKERESVGLKNVKKYIYIFIQCLFMFMCVL